MLSILIPFWGFTPPQKKVVDLHLKLLNTKGQLISLAEQYDHCKGLMVVFTCNHCPFAKLYPERLNQLNKEFSPQGVPLIAISSTDTIQYEEDTYELMKENARLNHLNFPYLYDANQEAAKRFHANRTPHIFVLWKEKGNWIIKYDGAIDDNGAEAEKVIKPYAAIAVKALLKGQPVKIKHTASVGCQIYFRK